MKKLEELKEWIAERDALKLSKLEKPYTTIPARTLHQVLAGSKPAIPETHLFSLCLRLSKYGLEIGGFRVCESKGNLTLVNRFGLVERTFEDNDQLLEFLQDEE